jgi:hypothetical protein
MGFISVIPGEEVWGSGKEAGNGMVTGFPAPFQSLIQVVFGGVTKSAGKKFADGGGCRMKIR